MHPTHTLTLALLIILTSGISFVFAWTGPTQTPPGGNVSAPINIGTTDQVKNGGLSVNSLIVYGNTIISGTSKYLNFGTTAGATGYGIRDNAGVMEVKNNGGLWARFATTTSSGTFNQIRFTDGTTQTTAASPGASGVGISQTWQNVSASRVSGTPYRNDTELPIMVSIDMRDNSTIWHSSDGVLWVQANNPSSDRGLTSFIVPPNGYYKYTGGVEYWLELR